MHDKYIISDVARGIIPSLGEELVKLKVKSEKLKVKT
jgi:hypothetical protein